MAWIQADVTYPISKAKSHFLITLQKLMAVFQPVFRLRFTYPAAPWSPWVLHGFFSIGIPFISRRLREFGRAVSLGEGLLWGDGSGRHCLARFYRVVWVEIFVVLRRRCESCDLGESRFRMAVSTAVPVGSKEGFERGTTAFRIGGTVLRDG